MLQITAPYSQSLQMPAKNSIELYIDVCDLGSLYNMLRMCGSDLVMARDNIRGLMTTDSCTSYLDDVFIDDQPFFITVTKTDAVVALFSEICENIPLFRTIDGAHILNIGMGAYPDCMLAKGEIQAITLIDDSGHVTLETIEHIIREIRNEYEIDMYSLNNFYEDVFGYVLKPRSEYERWERLTKPTIVYELAVSEYFDNCFY